ncbi:hypothetical protein K450DRAFT_240969 [Umbelopsis ramanniana AG]|uniref:Uncharacterized protein n=1 Tax=Umbelopsis ramanniana AG TaxID=1314678 RepID=A0AAD5EAE2_UMBRA|nr:uncharacterized protein K450DRAFT_240969 [Umbelopsis ramanniana AG]KAI8579672.1 hypothetical protein K450DRAFT_240969 [Umbelopsis ramanniana AG]
MKHQSIGRQYSPYRCRLLRSRFMSLFYHVTTHQRSRQVRCMFVFYLKYDDCYSHENR